jgi:hypothetical protein
VLLVKNIVSALLVPLVTTEILCGFSPPEEKATRRSELGATVMAFGRE